MSGDAGAEGARWLAQATDDLVTARLLVANDRHAVACFLAQQAAEKAHKGLLYAGRRGRRARPQRGRTVR